VLKRDDYAQVARRNAEFLLNELGAPGGRLFHTWRAGVARGNGYLEDYAYLIDGLIELYQATFDPRWYTAAHELAEKMMAHFSAPGGGFYDTSDDHEELIVRPRDLQDNAVPSGNAMAAHVLLRLSGLAAEPRYLELARVALSSMQEMLTRYPLGFGQWLIALDDALAHPREVSIVGAVHDPAARALLDACATGYRPHQIVALGEAESDAASIIPLLQGRPQKDGRATAYVCVDFVCRPPVTDAGELEKLVSDQKLYDEGEQNGE
jgi:uncharacterized protein YyaL (SSP411 family)